MNETQRHKRTIVVTGADLAPEAVAILHDFSIVYAGKQPDEEQLVSVCRATQPVALIVRYGRITARVIEASQALRVISKHGVGIDTIDTHTAAARGIAVKAAIAVNADAVTEHAWGFILACAKSMPALNVRMHGGDWDKATHKSLELAGLTLGVIGVGAIGSRVAAVGVVLRMRVIAYDPYVHDAPAGVTLTTLEDVLQNADVLTLHCPLTPETRHIIDAAALARMREGAILINTARGGLVDEAALVKALRSGRLRAAALDTFEQEPPPANFPLHNVPGLIMTPHVAGVTSDTYRNMGVAAARNILAVLEAKEEAK
jgi:D-3-phosphoglycerate dehydrogenase